MSERKQKALLVFGTRPEAIKMCPLVLELKKRDRMEVRVCVTGQHREMLDQVLAMFRVRPDYDLDIMMPGQTLFEITARTLERIRAVLEDYSPDLVFVHGDTTTAFAAATAAFYKQIPVAHVEAGLRTDNLYSPYPEEFNRRAISLVTAWHFSPTERARHNLLAEGKDAGTIYVTGNTGIDAMRYTVDPDYRSELTDWAEGSRLLVITAHRRENLGEHMHHMFRAIRRILESYPDTKAVYPVHLNPLVRQVADEELGGMERMRLIEPLGVLDFHNLMNHSYLILTDSGGIQEEAPYLKKPVIVMRDTTERPEGLESGTLLLAGTDENVIYDACRTLLDNPERYAAMQNAVNPYGDGHASERIAAILEDRFLPHCDS